MKRRAILKTLAAMPAVAAAQQDPVPPRPTPSRKEEAPRLEATNSDAIANATAPRFFSAAQFAALQHLCDLIAPAVRDTPGALAAGAPQFLDFLVSQSPAEKQTLYRKGLDTLVVKRFPANADQTLAPLREAWTYEDPADPFAHFLRDAKQDILTATVNSRGWIEAVHKRNPRVTGQGTYWFPIE